METTFHRSLCLLSALSLASVSASCVAVDDEAEEDFDRATADEAEEPAQEGDLSDDDDVDQADASSEDVIVLDPGRARPGERLELVDGLFALVPEPGDTVTMEVIYDDGDMYLVSVDTDSDGSVRIRLPEAGFTSGAHPSASCPSKCNHTAYSLLGYKWNKRLDWRYRDSGRPSSIGKDATITALRYAATTITSSRNVCDMSDQVSATHKYLGTTSTAPNVSYSGGSVTCLASDGKNVIGWGSLPSNMLGITCTWSSNGVAVSSDARYNKAIKWFTGNDVPQSCNARWSLRAVAAHEFGHSFGLNHSGCQQTMSPTMPACSSHRRRLGKSDVRGLRKLY